MITMARCALLVSVTITLVAGCAPAMKSAARGGIDYPYGPASMQMHSLSRLVVSASGTVDGAVVFIDFNDRDNQSSRATGVLEVAIELPGNRVVEKSMDLTSLVVNDELWSRTVRMYRVEFQFDLGTASQPSSGLPVSVSWTPIDEVAITSSGVLCYPNRR